MIWITEWLCPNRHNAIGVAWDDNDKTREGAESFGEEVFLSGLVNRWCGICSGPLHVETQQTTYDSMEEAAPYLKELQAASLAQIRLHERRN